MKIEIEVIDNGWLITTSTIVGILSKEYLKTPEEVEAKLHEIADSFFEKGE